MTVKCLAQAAHAQCPRPGARFSEAPETFRARKAVKSRTLRLQSCFIHIFLILREATFIQEVSGVYTSPLLDTDEPKMALRARKVSGAFEKRAPGLEPRPLDPELGALPMRPLRLHPSSCRSGNLVEGNGYDIRQS